MKLSSAIDILEKAKNPQGYELHGTIDLHGLHIKVENKKGSVRSGKDPNGKSWGIKMQYPYGYISRTKAADGEHVDVYIGDDRKSEKVFVIHQNNPWDGKYDEDKVMMGFKTAKEAKKAYLAHYDSSKFFGSMTTMDIEQFKKSLKKNKGMKLEKAIAAMQDQYILTELELAELVVKGTVVHVGDMLEKAVGKEGLVQKKVWVSKNGRTYQTTVWVKVGDEDLKSVKDKATDVAVGQDIAVNVLGMGIKRYSDKAVLVTGDTYDNVTALREVKAQTGAGNFNRKLKGWIFPVKYLSNLLGQLISNSEHEQTGGGEMSVDIAIANENRKEVKNSVPVGTSISTPVGKGKVTGVTHNGNDVRYTVTLTGGKVIKDLEEGDFTKLEETNPSKIGEVINSANPTNRAAAAKALAGSVASGSAAILAHELELNKGKEVTVQDLQKKRDSFVNRLKGLATPKKAGKPSEKKKSKGYSARASMTKAELNAKLEEMGMMSVEDFYKSIYDKYPSSGIQKQVDKEDSDARSKAMMGNKNAEGKRGSKVEEDIKKEAAKIKEKESDSSKTKEGQDTSHRTVKRGSKEDIKKKTAKKDIKKAGKAEVSGEGTSKRIYSITDLFKGYNFNQEKYQAKEGWGTSTKIRKILATNDGEVLAKGSTLTIIGEAVRQGVISNEDVEAYFKGMQEDLDQANKEWSDKFSEKEEAYQKALEGMNRENRIIMGRLSSSQEGMTPEMSRLRKDHADADIAKLPIDAKQRELDEIKGVHLANIKFEISETSVKNIKSGKTITAKDYRNLSVKEMRVYTAKNVLDTPRPNWIPEVSQKALERKSYDYDALRMESGDYLVALDGFVKNEDISYEHNKDHDPNYIVMSREHFAAMHDYYITRQKALNKREADERNKANKEKEAKWDDATKARYPGGYKKHGAKRVKVMKPKEYLKSQAHMVREFIDPDLDRYAVAGKIIAMKEDLGIAWADFTVSSESYSGAFQKGRETSYGETGATKELLKSHGVKIKKQNGDEMDSGTQKWISDRMDEVYKSFGNRKEEAREWNMKVSHSGSKRMHAKKAVGIFFPQYNAIGVSEAYGSEKGGFTLAHEFAHFLDYRMAAKSTSGGDKRYFASHDTSSTAGKIAIAMRENMNDREMSKHKYYGCSHECFARAMEQYHAMKHGGDDVVKVGATYSDSPEQVKKDVFNKEIKPLIEQFVKESGEILKAAMNDLIILEAKRLG